MDINNDETRLNCALNEPCYNASKPTMANNVSDVTMCTEGDSTIMDNSDEEQQAKSMAVAKGLGENFPSVSSQLPPQESAFKDEPSLDSMALPTTTTNVLESSVSRSSNNNDDLTRLRRRDNKQSIQRLVHDNAGVPVGAIAVAGFRARSNAWDDESTVSDIEDNERDDGINCSIRGWDDGLIPTNEGIQSQSVDGFPNLPTAQVVTRENSTELDPFEAREQFAIQTREAITAEVPHAEPVTASPPSKVGRLYRAILLGGLILPLTLAVISGVLILVIRRPTEASSSPPMTSAVYPTTLDVSKNTYSPTSSPIVLLRDGRKAFTTTAQLRNAADEYCLLLKNSGSEEELESSDVAKEYGYPIGTWDVSRVTDFSRIFDPDRGLRLEVSRNPSVLSSFDEDLSGWNVSNAVTVQGMFASANSFTGKGLERWNVGKVTDFSFLFAKATKFNGNLSLWNTSSAVRMDAMFAEAMNFNGDLTQWDVSRVTSVTYMFNVAVYFEGGDLRKWNVAKVTDMSNMFALSGFSGKVSTWDTSKVTNMEHMFMRTQLNDDLSSWSVEKVNRMSGMFTESVFRGGNLNRWNTSRVTDMSTMFRQAKKFQGNISLWDVSNVENFEFMFSDAVEYDGDLSHWQTTSAINMNYMFYFAQSFSGVNLTLWDTRKVTSMSYMFGYALKFNRDLSPWDVSSLTDASFMFINAASFDQNLCSWGERLSSTVEVAGMFTNASSCPKMSDPSIINGTLGSFCHYCNSP